jgi:parvulin-like peptidyl-prolyl isomerase
MSCGKAHVRIGGLTAFVLLVIACLPNGSAAAERQVVEGILVRVNDRIITVSDFHDRLATELSQIPAPPQGEDLIRFSNTLFEMVVDELVLLERAEEKRLTVDEEMVDRAIMGLREENNLLEEEAFREALDQAGLTEESLRERYRHTMIQQRVVQSEISPTEVTEEEVRKVYEETLQSYEVPEMVELQQLFFEAASGEGREAVVQRARGLVERVAEGSDLKAEATLAGVELVDVGQIPLDDLRPERRRALASIAEGELTAPLDASDGVLVLRLVRRIPSGHRPFEEVKEEIRRSMSLKAYEDQSRGLVNKLKKDYLVEVHRDRLALALVGLTDV